MTVALEDLRDEIRREERSAGLNPTRPLTRADIERRRRQIAQVGLVVFFGIVISTLRANVWGNSHDALFDPDLLRAATITAAGGFIAYVVEKERHLRRLVLLESEERSVQLAIADRLLEAAAFADASSSVQGSLVLERVIARTLDRVRDLVRTDAGTIRLLSADGQLRVAATFGSDDGFERLGGVAFATRVGLGQRAAVAPRRVGSPRSRARARARCADRLRRSAARRAPARGAGGRAVRRDRRRDRRRFRGAGRARAEPLAAVRGRARRPRRRAARRTDPRAVRGRVTSAPMGAFDGRVALVTGGASGIGRATALRLARDGAAIAVLDRDGDGARAVAAEVGGHAYEVDVRDGDAVRAATAAVVDDFGGLTILVNNAGVGDLRPMHTVDDRLWHRLVDVNLTGTFHAMAAAVIPAMLAAGGGAIVNNASVSGLAPTRNEAAYSAAKAGVIALDREWRARIRARRSA